ncbi:MAG: ArsR/SmtB family transcription factor [Actinomycetota bacterium]
MVPRRQLTDPETLKALAHPLRMELVESLRVHGAQTATELAARLGSSPSNCSWHLRKLAEHGFVTEAEQGPGRSRPWQAAREGLTWDEADAAPEIRTAGQALTETLLGRELRLLSAAQRSLPDESPAWRRSGTVVQSVAWLTADEAMQLSAELGELMMRHVDRLDDPEKRPEGARLVSLVGWLALRPEAGSTEGSDVR